MDIKKIMPPIVGVPAFSYVILAPLLEYFAQILDDEEVEY